MIKVKRIYDAPGPDDGCRVLVDRLWPRGMTREAAAIDLWLREAAPSDALRRWYNHDSERWPGFQKRYRDELAQAAAIAALVPLRAKLAEGDVTLLFATKELLRNNAQALKAYLESTAIEP